MGKAGVYKTGNLEHLHSEMAGGMITLNQDHEIRVLTQLGLKHVIHEHSSN